MKRQRLLGKGQIAICRRSGIKCHASELVRDGRIPSLLVLPEWADPPQPQERPYVPDTMEGAPRFPVSPETPPATAPVLSGVSAPLAGPGVNLTWTAAVRDAGPRIEEYDITRDESGAGYVLIDTVVVEYDMFGKILGPGLAYRDEDVVGGTPYSYKVIALTSNGRGLTSNAVTVTPIAPL